MIHGALFKKIMALSWYDFSNNLGKWFSITGLLAIGIILLFCAISFVTGDFTISSWQWAPNLLLDFVEKGLDLIFSKSSLALIIPVTLFSVVVLFLVPRIILQNCLDLAFDSSMRGFSFDRIYWSYAGAMIIGHSCVHLVVSLLSYLITSLFVYLMSMQVQVPMLVVKIVLSLFCLVIFYCLQLVYVYILHVLEYQTGLRKSAQDVWGMVKGKFSLLSQFLLLQLTIAGTVLAALYFGLSFVISVVMRFVVWPFVTMDVEIFPKFIVFMYNFFYAWTYFFLLAWVCLMLAHLYRQLMCPPTENVGCSSCQDCN